MANVEDTLLMVQACFRHNMVPVLVSGRGKGKTMLGAQIAEAMGAEFLCLQMSQLEPPDFVGLPSFPDDILVSLPDGNPGKVIRWDGGERSALVMRDSDRLLSVVPWDELEITQHGKVTKHIRPDFFPDPNATSKGVILLDEINRARADTRASLFDFILYRRVMKYVLPPGWHIICAMNPPGAGYQVAELDKALADRLCILNFKPTSHDWIDFESRRPDASSDIVQYIQGNPEELDPADEVDGLLDKGTITADRSRRSWSAVARMHKDIGIVDRIRPELYAGIIGKASTSKLLEFLKKRTFETSWIGMRANPVATVKQLAAMQSAEKIGTFKANLSQLFRELRLRNTIDDKDIKAILTLIGGVTVYDLVAFECRKLLVEFESNNPERYHTLSSNKDLIAAVRARR